MTKTVTLALLVFGWMSSALAAEKMIDLSSGCKVYKLEDKKWVETDAASMEGLGLEKNQILRDAAFTVFKTADGTFGLNQRCVKAAEATAASAPAPEAPPSEPAPRPVGKRRSAAPATARGDTHSPWSAVFSLGYNLLPKGTVTTVYGGSSTSDSVKYTGSIAFMGEGNYRFSSAFRMAAELGISQLEVNSLSGNETSFFDVRPEFVFRAGRKIEMYIGPMLGLFFLSQNTESRTFTSGPAAGTTIDVKQQTASAALLGVGIGGDYVLNEQFDLGLFFRYFKPGTLKVTGTESFPTPGNTYESDLSTSYITSGLRFAIHF